MTDAVLFDFDGTLADTATDMGRALNRLLAEHGRPPLEQALIRSEVSHGGRALVALAFAEREGGQQFERLRQRFLDIYAADMCTSTTLFAGMDAVLAELEARHIPWGVVTNKPSRFTLPVLECLRLHERVAVVVCADTAGAAKPDPKPLLDACAALRVRPERCVYIGDDRRDVAAAHGAGMACVAWRCGYIRRGEDPDDWGADVVVDTAAGLSRWLAGQIKAAA